MWVNFSFVIGVAVELKLESAIAASSERWRRSCERWRRSFLEGRPRFFFINEPDALVTVVVADAGDLVDVAVTLDFDLDGDVVVLGHFLVLFVCVFLLGTFGLWGWNRPTLIEFDVCNLGLDFRFIGVERVCDLRSCCSLSDERRFDNVLVDDDGAVLLLSMEQIGGNFNFELDLDFTCFCEGAFDCCFDRCFDCCLGSPFISFLKRRFVCFVDCVFVEDLGLLVMLEEVGVAGE